jgi:hypothetical protein
MKPKTTSNHTYLDPIRILIEGLETVAHTHTRLNTINTINTTHKQTPHQTGAGCGI